MSLRPLESAGKTGKELTLVPQDKRGLGWHGSPRSQADPVVWGIPAHSDPQWGTVDAEADHQAQRGVKGALMSHISFKDRLAGPWPQDKAVGHSGRPAGKHSRFLRADQQETDTSSPSLSCAFRRVSLLPLHSAPRVTWETTYQFPPQQTCPLPTLELLQHLQRKKTQILVGKPETDWNRAAEISQGVTGQNHVPNHPVPPVITLRSSVDF